MVRFSTLRIPQPRRVLNASLLILLIAVSLSLNASGNTWGLAEHWHPDEIASLAAVLWDRQALLPEPHALMYGNLLSALYLPIAGLRTGFPTDAAWLGKLRTALERADPAAVRIGRFLNAVLGAGIAAGTWVLARAIGAARREAFLAALIVLTAGGIVQHSHFATLDVPLVLFTTLAVALLARLTSRLTPTRVVSCAVLIGSAAATKHIPGLLLAVLLTVIIRAPALSRPQRLRLSLVAALVTGGIYLAINPFLMEYAVQARSTFAHLRAYFLVENQYAEPGITQFPQAFLALTGGAFALLAPALALVGFTSVSRRTRLTLLLSFVALTIPYLLSRGTIARYYLPLVPLIAATAARAPAHAPRSLRIARSAAVIALLAGNLLYTAEILHRFKHDTRPEAFAWLSAHVPPGATLETTPGALSAWPPHITVRDLWTPAAGAPGGQPGMTTDLLRARDPDYVLLHEGTYLVAFLSRWKRAVPEAHAFYTALLQAPPSVTGYCRTKTFEPRLLHPWLAPPSDFVAPRLVLLQRAHRGACPTSLPAVPLPT